MNGELGIESGWGLGENASQLWSAQGELQGGQSWGELRGGRRWGDSRGGCAGESVGEDGEWGIRDWEWVGTREDARELALMLIVEE